MFEIRREWLFNRWFSGRSSPVRSAVRSVVDRLESRTLLTAVTAIDFDYGSSLHAIRVTFDGPVSPASISTGDIYVRKVGADTSRLANTMFGWSLTNSNTVARFTYVPGFFPDGDYVVDLYKDDILDASGQPLAVDASSSFFFMYADFSGPNGVRDRLVDVNDTAYVGARIGTANPTYGDGDMDLDGAVTVDDALQVIDYYDTKLITPVDGLQALTATAENTTNVRLSWARKSTTNTGFRVQRSSDGGRNFTTIASSLSPTTETYLDTTANLSSAGYVYRVRSIEPNQPFSSIATPSRYFNASIAQNATEGGSPIAAPEDLRVVSVAKNSLTLEWADTSTGEDGFEFYRSDDGGVSYKSVKYLQVPNATTWTDTNLKADKTYYYYARARSSTATSTNSDVANGTTLEGAPTVIKASITDTALPQEVIAEFDQPILKNVDVLSDLHVTVYSLTGGRQLIGGSNGEFTIVDSTAGEIVRAKFNGALAGSGILPNGNYEILVRGDAVKNAAGQTIADAQHPDFEGAASTFFLRGDFNRDRRIGFDDLLILAQNYGQPNRTHAQGDTNFDGLTDFSDLLYLTQRYQTGLPEPLSGPNQLSASTAQVVDPTSEIFLEWTPPENMSEPVLGYRLWRSDDGGATFSELEVNLGPNDTTYIDDDGLQEGTRYVYRIRPFSVSSLGVTTNRAAVATTLQAPSQLTVTSVGSTTVVLGWIDNSDTEEKYNVFVCTPDGEVLRVIEIGADSETSTITNLEAGVEYVFRVAAWSAAANSVHNFTPNVRTSAPLSAPTVSATSEVSGTIKLSIVNKSPNSTQTVIDRFDSSSNSWTQVAVVSSKQANWTDMTAEEGKSYYYRVKSQNFAGTSGVSVTNKVVCKSAAPITPENVSYIQSERAPLKLTWESPPNASRFIVEYSTDNGVYRQLGWVAGTSREFVPSGLSSGIDYAFRVIAENSGGQSLPSESVVVDGEFIIDTRVLFPGVPDEAYGEDGFIESALVERVSSRPGIVDSKGRYVWWREFYDGKARISLTRLKADGTADSSLISDPRFVNSADVGQSGDYYYPINASASQMSFIEKLPNGDYVVAAEKQHIDLTITPNSVTSIAMVLLILDGETGTIKKEIENATGSSYHKFEDLQLDEDGRIYVIIAPNYYNQINTLYVSRYLASGELDLSFNGGHSAVVPDNGVTNATFGDMAVLPGGGVVVSRQTVVSGSTVSTIAKIGDDGLLDTSFGSGGQFILNQSIGQFAGRARLAIMPDERIVVFAQSYRKLLCLTSQGSIDDTFGDGGIVDLTVSLDTPDGYSHYPAAIGVSAEGRIAILSGYGTTVGPDNYYAISVFESDGELDATFGGDGVGEFSELSTSYGYGQMNGLMIADDGMAYVSGYADFPVFTTEQKRRIARMSIADHVEMVVHGTRDDWNVPVDNIHGPVGVPVNRDFDGNGESRDFESQVALLDLAARHPADDELVRVTLKALGEIGGGSIEISVSNDESLQLFGESGERLQASDLVLDFGNPAGYLEDLLFRDVDVWLQASDADTDLSFMLERTGDGHTLTKEIEIVTTGARLGLDNNRDGAISFANGADVTSVEKPFVFWLNEDDDEWGGEEYEAAVDEGSGPYSQDASDNVIGPSVAGSEVGTVGVKEAIRADLEDFAQMSLVWSDSVHASTENVRITFEAIDQAPGIRLWRGTPEQSVAPNAISSTNHVDHEESINWIMSVNRSYSSESALGPSIHHGSLLQTDGEDASITLSRSEFYQAFGTNEVGDGSDDWLSQILFEGVSAGTGKLRFAFLDAEGGVLDEATAVLELHHLRDMYDEYSVSYGPNVDPVFGELLSSNGVLDQGAPIPTSSRLETSNKNRATLTEDYFLFVHGWRMDWRERRGFAENTFKRMFWSGYQGQFGLFSWPTQSIDNPAADAGNFDRSEFAAWNSAAGLKSTLRSIGATSAVDGKLSVMAHSMGNIVLSEALYQAEGEVGTQGLLADNVIISQAALSAAYYQSDMTMLPSIYKAGLLTPGGASHVPAAIDHVNGRAVNRPLAGGGSYTEYLGLRPYGQDLDVMGGQTPRFRNISVSAGKILNYFNPDDYALAAWKFDQMFKPTSEWSNGLLALAMKGWIDTGNVDVEATWEALTGWVFGDDIPGFNETEYDIVTDAAGESRIVRKYSGSTTHENVTLSYALNKYEMFAFGASSIVAAVGGVNNMSGLAGIFTGSTDLSILPGTSKFSALPPGHSAQFVHSFFDVGAYWKQLKADIQ